MSLTLLGALLIASSIAASALYVFRLPRLLSWLSPSGGAQWRGVQKPSGMLIAVAAVFLLIAGAGGAVSYLGSASAPNGAEDTTREATDGEMVTRLKDYARTIGEGGKSESAASKLLPDVNTMISRLAARLETAPDDVKGWRMLGWSYFHTGHYKQAASAYAKAVELDPSSAELKRSYEEASAKASETGHAQGADALPTKHAANSVDQNRAEKAASPEDPSRREVDAAIRSMVDGLAARLEASPRDVEGWTRLMRSRVVLGEREVAASAYRKALEVFQNDTAASDRITAAAVELGLKAE